MYGLHQLGIWNSNSAFNIVNQFIASPNSVFDNPYRMIAFTSWEEASVKQVNAFANRVNDSASWFNTSTN